MKPFPFSKKVIFAVGGLLLMIGILNFFQIEVQDFFYGFSAPFQSSLWRAGDKISNFFSSLKNVTILEKENTRLKAENLQLQHVLVLFEEGKKENEELRGALGLGLAEDFQLAQVQVIGKNIGEDILILNRGKNSGVEEQMPVITPQKVVVGRIVESSERFSKVLLLSHQNSSFDAQIPQKEILGVVKGQGGKQVVFDLIKPEQELQINDLIVTSTLGGLFPENLLVGRVREIRKNDVSPFQQALLESFFEVSEEEFLFVILAY